MSAVAASGAPPERLEIESLIDQTPSCKKRCSQWITTRTVPKPVSITLRITGLAATIILTGAGVYGLYTGFDCYPVTFVCSALPAVGGAVAALAGLFLTAQGAIGLRNRIRD